RKEIGGPDQNRTDDLLIANETLSQLSYGPTRGRSGAGLSARAERGGIWLPGVRPVKQRLRPWRRTQKPELPGAAGATLRSKPGFDRVRPNCWNPGPEATPPYALALGGSLGLGGSVSRHDCSRQSDQRGR